MRAARICLSLVFTHIYNILSHQRQTVMTQLDKEQIATTIDEKITDQSCKDVKWHAWNGSRAKFTRTVVKMSKEENTLFYLLHKFYGFILLHVN